MTKGDVRKLRRLRSRLEGGMDLMTCGDTDTIEIVSNQFGRELKTLNGKEYIVERTQIWRDSWILPILDELIARGSRQSKSDRFETSVSKVRD